MSRNPRVTSPGERAMDIRAAQEVARSRDCYVTKGKYDPEKHAKRIELVTEKIRSDPRWTGKGERSEAYMLMQVERAARCRARDEKRAQKRLEREARKAAKA